MLEETFGEDKSTIKLGKNTMSVLRKCAYNIARLLQMEKIFSPIPSRYEKIEHWHLKKQSKSTGGFYALFWIDTFNSAAYYT